MKNYILIIAVALFVLTSCEEETIVFDPVNGQTAVSFATTSFNVSIPEEGLVVEVPLNVTTVSSSDRTFEVAVDASSIGASADYTIGTATIPSGAFSGTLNVSFNFDPLVEGESNKLVLNLQAPSDGVVYSETVTIDYFKEIICNDFLITINADRFGSETTWEITDDTDAVVASGGPFPNVTGGATYTFDVFLEDGCYTFTIFDSYGDGQVDGTITGSYSIECSILSVATGGGAFGASESVDFCVNQ
ncbi:MAG: hypothetical protein WBG90_17495 [Saonia sp.]